MKIRLNRREFSTIATIGSLLINSEFECFTLEDRVRTKKIPKKTAIPAGEYRVIINHSNRFKKMMPLLLDVPHFKGIRIHPGNTAADTEGCILVGSSKGVNSIGGSRDAYRALYKKLLKASKAGDDIFITIKNQYVSKKK